MAKVRRLAREGAASPSVKWTATVSLTSANKTHSSRSASGKRGKRAVITMVQISLSKRMKQWHSRVYGRISAKLSTYGAYARALVIDELKTQTQRFLPKSAFKRRRSICQRVQKRAAERGRLCMQAHVEMHAILGQCSDDKREYFNKRFCLSAHRMAHQKFREADGRNFLIRGFADQLRERHHILQTFPPIRMRKPLCAARIDL